jgi:hypothetical protein
MGETTPPPLVTRAMISPVPTSLPENKYHPPPSSQGLDILTTRTHQTKELQAARQAKSPLRRAKTAQLAPISDP